MRRIVPIYFAATAFLAQGAYGQTYPAPQFNALGVNASAPGAPGTINVSNGYEINGSLLSAANLSNGTTGSGAVALATSPTLASPTFTGAATGASANFSGNVSAASLEGSSGTLLFTTPNTTSNGMFEINDPGTTYQPASSALLGLSFGAGNAYTFSGTVNVNWNLGGGKFDVFGTTQLGSLGVGTATQTSGWVNSLYGYQVNGSPLAAANLSDGTTGSGAIALSTSPTITAPTLSGTTTAGLINASSTYEINGISIYDPTVGSSGSPVTAANTVTFSPTIYGNYQPGSSNNPPEAIHATCYNMAPSTGASSNCRGVFGVGIDYSGNTSGTAALNNFVEGGRFAGQAASGVAWAATYGVIAYATGAAGEPYMGNFGVESQVDNQYADAPLPSAWTGHDFSADFLASSGESSGTYMIDAGFMTNPFNPNKFQSAFLVAPNTANYAGFTDLASSVWGIDLGLTTYGTGAIRLPNSSAIWARSADGSSNLNLMYLATDNTLRLGQGAVAVISQQDLTPASSGTLSLGSSGDPWQETYSNAYAGNAAGTAAPAGAIGEFQSNQTSGTTLTTGTTVNGTTLSLTAGVWDIQCVSQFQASAAIGIAEVGISTNSASMPGSIADLEYLTTGGAIGMQILHTPTVREDLTSSSTIYCPVQAQFTSGTATASAFIRATRVN